MSRKFITPSSLAIIIIILVSLILPVPARAGGTVGNGTPSSCTEPAFNAALVGGGFVNFNCGPNPLTIFLTNVKTIVVDTTIDGGGLITLSGSNLTRHFIVNAGYGLTLLNLALSDGSAAQGGAIYNNGTVIIFDSNLAFNNSPGGIGGAIYNQGTLQIYSSVLTNNNASGGIAGAIHNTGNLTIENSTLNNNSTWATGGSIVNYGTAEINSSVFELNQASSAGAIHNTGNLSVADSYFNYNSALSANGGGIYNESVLSINRSIFFGNNSAEGGKGGGLFNAAPAVAVINKTKFVLNGAIGGSGGGLANEGQVSILASQFAGNQANGGLGGGIYSFSIYPLTITNSTISGNSASGGGGVYIEGNPTTILNSTLYGNSYAGILVPSGNASFKNTILAANSPYNCAGVFSTQGYNLEDASTCAFSGLGDLTNTDPMLGPIQDNGGPTWTHALLPGSPAINAGTNSGCPGADQRGVKRPLFGTCDIGAYEYGFFQYLPVLVK